MMTQTNLEAVRELATSDTVIAFGYRARCTEAGCRSPRRVILRHADIGGAPATGREFCLKHGCGSVERYWGTAAHHCDNGEIA
jgi:hypothetical protein